MPLQYDPVRKLSISDLIDDFDCNEPALNEFLQRYALIGQKSNSSQTYVCCCDGRVVGFYSLAVGSIDLKDAPERIAKGMPRYAVPVMILARLAVDKTHQKRGLGCALLKDALRRTAQAADIAGIRALLVHAKNEDAISWYRQWEFDASPADTHHLMLLLKDLKINLATGD